MRLSESNMNAKINSEIHASLRRLEDADYVYNQIHAEDMNLIIDQSNEADESLQSQINALTKETYQLHNWIEPHVYLGDLQYFQTLFVGNLQVESGGLIQGNVTFTGGSNPITFEKNVKIDGGLDIFGDEGLFTPKITMGSFDEYNEHTFTVEGTTLEGRILATQDMSFNLVGLVGGSWSNEAGGKTAKYTVNTTGPRAVELDSTTVTITPFISYDGNTHKYTATANMKVGSTVWAVAANDDAAVSGDEAYRDGAGSVTACTHTNGSAKLSYAGTGNGGHGYMYQSSTKIVSSGSKWVYW